MKTNLLRLVAATAAFSLSALTAHAISYSFTDITGVSAANNTADQIKFDVIAGAGSTVRFNFTFAAGDAGIITSIGFGGTNSAFLTNTSTPTLFQGAGVSFTNGGMPNLGGGGFTQDYGVSRTSSGGVSNGMSIGETLGVQYSLVTGKSLVDITNSINSGNFKVGLHIQSLDNGGSQKAVNGTTPDDVDVPRVPDGGATVGLLGGALIGLLALRRKLG